jgi:4a-hydroxytetrahydrobiopterin dehydratase
MSRQPLDEAAIQAGLAALPAWRREGVRLIREYRFPDFRRGALFLTGAAFAAEALDHHPDWSGVYDRVRIELTTHSARALTPLDFALARELERLAKDLGAS